MKNQAIKKIHKKVKNKKWREMIKVRIEKIVFNKKKNKIN
jgi:hypothetical protein